MQAEVMAVEAMVAVSIHHCINQRALESLALYDYHGNTHLGVCSVNL